MGVQAEYSHGCADQNGGRGTIPAGDFFHRLVHLPISVSIADFVWRLVGDRSMAFAKYLHRTVRVRKQETWTEYQYAGLREVQR